MSESFCSNTESFKFYSVMDSLSTQSKSGSWYYPKNFKSSLQKNFNKKHQKTYCKSSYGQNRKRNPFHDFFDKEQHGYQQSSNRQCYASHSIPADGTKFCQKGLIRKKTVDNNMGIYYNLNGNNFDGKNQKQNSPLQCYHNQGKGKNHNVLRRKNGLKIFPKRHNEDHFHPIFYKNVGTTVFNGCNDSNTQDMVYTHFANNRQNYYNRGGNKVLSSAQREFLRDQRNWKAVQKFCDRISGSTRNQEKCRLSLEQCQSRGFQKFWTDLCGDGDLASTFFGTETAMSMYNGMCDNEREHYRAQV